MKSLLFFLVTAATLSANAGFLEPHIGRVKQSGSKSTCTLLNKTNSTLDMKYVVFRVESYSGEGMGTELQTRIDRRVHPGNAIKASAETGLGNNVNHCYFLSR